jgi:hypothetical protein
LGKVAPNSTGYATHLHLDAAGGPDATYQGLLRPIDDPLARLDPLGDMTAPTIGDVFFLRGEDDNNIPHALVGNSPLQAEPDRRTDHGYFKALDAATATAV